MDLPDLIPKRIDPAVSEPIADARQMLSDAATLCGWCAGHWNDETDRTEHNTKLHYAVDADVITMYSDPDRNRDNGKVFAQADEVSELVASLVGDFILHRLPGSLTGTDSDSASPAGALILIPPHNIELRSMVIAISGKVAKLSNRGLSTLVKQEKTALEKRLDGLDTDAATAEFLKFLSTHAADLHNLLLGETGAAAEMARLNLLPRHRLATPQKLPAFGNPNSLASPPLRDGVHPETISVQALADKWQDLMLMSEPPNLSPFKQNKVTGDAWALATLQWVNADAVQRNLKQRLILITGTQRLLDAGNERPASHDGFQNFAEAYLRDARALMGAKTFFALPGSNASDMKFRILEWMSVLFPNAVRQQRVVPNDAGHQALSVRVEVSLPDVQRISTGTELDGALDILIKQGYRRDEALKFPDSALKEWREVVSGTHSQMVLQHQKNVSEDLLKGMRHGRVTATGRDRLEHLLGALSKQVQQSFVKLYLATGVIGVEQLLDKSLSIRGLPALRFDEPYKTAHKIFEKLAYEIFKDPRPDKIDLAEMYDELYREDDSNYHAQVLHAFVYASSGRWLSARTLCLAALVVADTLPEPMRKRRCGREAAYLLAVAERRLAVNEKMLEPARIALKNARADRSVDDEADDLRFESEEFAQDITQQQMVYFSDRRIFFINPLHELGRALQLCEKMLRKEREHGPIRRWVIRQTVTNGLLVALMAVDSGLRLSQIVGMARKLVSILKEEKMAPTIGSTASVAQLYKDEISDFIWLVAVAQFEKPPTSSGARAGLKNWSLSEQSHAKLPFESSRYERLMRLVAVEPIIVKPRQHSFQAKEGFRNN